MIMYEIYAFDANDCPIGKYPTWRYNGKLTSYKYVKTVASQWMLANPNIARVRIWQADNVDGKAVSCMGWVAKRERKSEFKLGKWL